MWTFREIYHVWSKVVSLSFYAKFNCLDRWHSIAWLCFNVHKVLHVFVICSDELPSKNSQRCPPASFFHWAGTWAGQSWLSVVTGQAEGRGTEHCKRPRSRYGSSRQSLSPWADPLSIGPQDLFARRASIHPSPILIESCSRNWADDLSHPEQESCH